MKNATALTYLMSLILAGTPTIAGAGVVLDQSDTSGVTGYYTPSLPVVVGESFTPTASSMNFAELYTNYNADYEIGVQVEVLDGTGLSGKVLGVSFTDTYTPPPGPWTLPPRPVDFTFPSSIALTPGHQYTLAVLVQPPQVYHQNFFPVGTTGSNSYAGGDRYSTASGTGPQADDLYFKVGQTAPGDSQSDPLLPNSMTPTGQFTFSSVASGAWFDPATAYGFEYHMTSGSLFTAIDGFPTGFNQPFTVSSGGTVLGQFAPGDTYTFGGSGVSDFSITGISPLVDPSNASAFPLQLAFNTPTADFTMTPLSAATPEPGTLSLWSIAACLFGTITARKRLRPSRDSSVAPER